ncbi:MAG: hypothetical protein M3Z04_22205 [Chloroflexota bacterium]|nr:hypothetical protein [Chloroflexota bacterium]
MTFLIDPVAATTARRTLLAWYPGGARSFPWRGARDPYQVLVAELMLRRTQARQVAPVYLHFLQHFPTVRDLDQATADAVSALLYPLGLGWRAANFKALAAVIMARFAGQIPADRTALLSLPGVGPYVADAVRCFAFGVAAPLVDTNTVRVAARYFGFAYTQESRRRPAVIAAVAALVDPADAARSNYALLDFAAIVCQARTPHHAACPLAGECRYYLQQQRSTASPSPTPLSAQPDDDSNSTLEARRV